MNGHLVFHSGGLLTTVQDEGRTGWQRYGISVAGAVDMLALHAANALVGNPVGTAALEITAAGPDFTVEVERCRVALAGADFALALNGVPALGGRGYDLARGDRVSIGAARSGLRGYLAVAGGFDLAPVLGSRSTHTRSGIGGIGRRVEPGDRLELTGYALSGPELALGAPLASTTGPVRVVLGPQDDAFTEEAIATLFGAAFTVSARADRMGCLLDGPALAHRAGFNIVSDGVVNGSIQVPGHGRPVVLLADRQSTGGYPKIATVISADLRRIGQRRPGEEVRFARVSVEEAVAAAREAADSERALLAGLVPVREAAPSTERLLGANLISGVVWGE